MPPADYATMPAGPGTAGSKRERSAELILARLADAQLTLSGRPVFQVAQVVLLASQVLTGVWLRSLGVPRGWQVAAACGLLTALALAQPAIRRLGSQAEPQWARAAAVHEQSLAGRVPEATLRIVRQVMDSMTARTRWRGAHFYVSRCTEEDPVHFAACCAGGTCVMNGRLLVILGEHLATGSAELAAAVLAHERRHVTGWRLYALILGAFAGSWGLIPAAWALPWPAALLAVLGLRAAATATAWLTEISCDLGSARDTSPAAILESLDFKARTQGGTRALQPRGKRWAISILTWAAGPDHPPLPLRRAAIRALA